MAANSQGTGGQARSTSLDSAIIISQEDAIVFSKLLPSGDNMSKFDRVAGMIAYAQYALYKHQFIEQYSKEEGKPPVEAHLKSIILTFKDEELIDQNLESSVKGQ